MEKISHDSSSINGSQVVYGYVQWAMTGLDGISLHEVFNDQIFLGHDTASHLARPQLPLAKVQFFEGQPVVDIADQECHEYLISGPLTDRSFISRLSFVLFNLGEYARQAHLNLVSAHASAVLSPSGTAHLILGEYGTGKSGIVLELCLKHGYSIIGEDLALIQGGVEDMENILLLPGLQLPYVREAVLKSILGIEDSESESNFEKKLTIAPSEIGIQTEKGGAYPLRSIFRVNVSPFNPEIATSNCLTTSSKMSEAVRLNRNFAQRIRGITEPLVRNEEGIFGYFPPLDTKRLTEKRNNLIRQLLSRSHPFYYINSKTHSKGATKINDIIEAN